MLLNPFTPSSIVSMPGEFFGRLQETQTLERSILQGSVAICGAVGVGKSSLLSHILLVMEGFRSEHKAQTVVAVGNKDIRTVDELACVFLEEFVQIDETQKRVKVMIPKVLEWESAEICRNFRAGRHLSVLQRILENKTLSEEPELLILALDEADKCPVPLARFVKSLITYVQHAGIKNVRFLVTGISPFFQLMVKEAPGVQRIFYEKLDVLPLLKDEATELVETKFEKLRADVQAQKQQLEIDPIIIGRVVQLSGGHPHLLQLLGSHIVEHEDSDPDGLIDSRDLLGALSAICYEDRAWVYDSLIHTLELEGVFDPLKKLLASAKATLPTRIEREKAQDTVERETLQWLVANDVLSIQGDEYRLNDEFLRIRIIMDEDRQAAQVVEKRLIEDGSFEDEDGSIEEEAGIWPES